MKRIDFQPVLFDTLKNYSKEKFFTEDVYKRQATSLLNISLLR